MYLRIYFNCNKRYLKMVLANRTGNKRYVTLECCVGRRFAFVCDTEQHRIKLKLVIFLFF